MMVILLAMLFEDEMDGGGISYGDDEWWYISISDDFGKTNFVGDYDGDAIVDDSEADDVYNGAL